MNVSGPAAALWQWIGSTVARLWRTKVARVRKARWREIRTRPSQTPTLLLTRSIRGTQMAIAARRNMDLSQIPSHLRSLEKSTQISQGGRWLGRWAVGKSLPLQKAFSKYRIYFSCKSGSSSEFPYLFKVHSFSFLRVAADLLFALILPQILYMGDGMGYNRLVFSPVFQNGRR